MLNGTAGTMSQPCPELDRRQFLAGLVTVLAAKAWKPSLALAAEAPGLTQWQSALMTLFPHPGLAATRYDTAAAALTQAAEASPGREVLLGGWAELEAAAGGNWGAADAEARHAAMATLAATPFFNLLRQMMVFTFYNDPANWESFGYRSDAWSFGGWLALGVDTIDWLPNPASVEQP